MAVIGKNSTNLIVGSTVKIGSAEYKVRKFSAKDLENLAVIAEKHGLVNLEHEFAVLQDKKPRLSRRAQVLQGQIADLDKQIELLTAKRGTPEHTDDDELELLKLATLADELDEDLARLELESEMSKLKRTAEIAEGRHKCLAEMASYLTGQTDVPIDANTLEKIEAVLSLGKYHLPLLSLQVEREKLYNKAFQQIVETQLMRELIGQNEDLRLKLPELTKELGTKNPTN